MNQTFTDEEVGQALQSVLSAVEYLHSNNIIHRDIKPCIWYFHTSYAGNGHNQLFVILIENLLIREKNKLESICLCDFGLSTEYSETDPTRNMFFFTNCGTFLYQAPEF